MSAACATAIPIIRKTCETVSLFTAAPVGRSITRRHNFSVSGKTSCTWGKSPFMMRSRHTLKSYRARRRILIIYCVWVKSGMSIASSNSQEAGNFCGEIQCLHDNQQVQEYWNRDGLESMYDKHLLKAEAAEGRNRHWLTRPQNQSVYI